MDEAVYTVEEIEAPEGYRIDPENHKDIALEWGKTKTLVFSDTKNPVLEIQKIDSQTKKPLAGAKFKVIRTEGTLPRTWRGDTKAEAGEGHESNPLPHPIS